MAVVLGTEGPETRSGTDGNDTFILLGGDDVGFGGKGSDIMNGGSGDDSLFGGDDADTLIGSFGADHLSGNGGADLFKFFAVEESPVGIGFRDVIEDFQPGADLIDLRSVDADTTRPGDQRFTFIGSQTFHGVPGEMRANIDSTGAMVLRMDVDGDKVADMHIEVHGAGSLFADNFLL